MRESRIQAEIRLAAAQSRGAWLMRNNSGALKDKSGTLVRFGLGNDSSQLNAKLKSLDLVGIRPVLIQQHHVGRMIGQFIAIDAKESAWRGVAGSERGIAQAAWGDLVRSWGGVAGFANSVEMAKSIWEAQL